MSDQDTQGSKQNTKPIASNPAPAETPKGIPKDATVLVVEDNVSNFVLIARLLGFLNIHCEWKTSGYEVVEYADTLPRLDLILLDIRLPYEDGYAALKKIRQSDRLKNLPIIAVTAEGTQEQMNKAKAAGFNGCIGQPLDPDKFPDQIRRIFNNEPVWEIPYEQRGF